MNCIRRFSLVLMMACWVCQPCHAQFNNLSLTSSDITVPSRVGNALYSLPNGKLIVMGGDDGRFSPTIYGTTGLFTIATRQNVAGPNMVMPRTDFGHAQLPNGDIILAGGLTATSVTNTCEKYVASTNSFVAISPMQVARQTAQGVRLMNGKVLVVGGDTSRTTELYDPANDAWTRVGDTHFQHYAYANLTLLNDGRVLLVGDLALFSNGNNRAEIFDPATNQWSAVAQQTITPKQANSSIVMNDGQVLLVGGRNSVYCELFDPVTETFQMTDSLDTPRERCVLVTLNSGDKLLVGNAVRFDPNWLSGLIMDLYEIGQEQWLRLPFDEHFRSYGTHVRVNNSIYTFGGKTPGDVLSNGDSYLITDRTLVFIESAKLPRLGISPNPADGQVSISLGQFEVSSGGVLVVYDMLGREVRSISVDGSGAWQVDLSNWEAGHYLLVLESEGKRIASGKLVKQ